MKQLEIKHLAPYLPYGLKVNFKYVKEAEKSFTETLDVNNLAIIIHQPIVKPILYPLGYLTKEITHNGETFVPIEHFEIGDDDNYSYEFDNGNIKIIIIQNLKCIAKYNNWHDINFLPFAVVQQLIEWRFDVFNLINDGLAIPVTEDFNPYK